MTARIGALMLGLALLGCGGRARTSSEQSSGSGGGTPTPVTGAGFGGTSTGFGASTGLAGSSSENGLGDGGSAACLTCSSDGPCVDINTDPMNCGSCGRACVNGVCKQGTCFSASGGTQLATAENPIALAVDGVSVYWLDNSLTTNGLPSTVKRCPVSGCNGAPVTLWTSSTPLAFLAIAAGKLWSTTGQSVVSCPLAGCTGEASVLATISSMESPIAAFSVDAVRAAWGTNTGAYSCPTSGCAGNGPLKLFQSQGEEAGFALQNQQLFGVNLAFDGNFGFGEINHLFACSLSGCAMGPVVLGNIQTKGTLTFDADAAYFVDAGTSDTAFAGPKPIPPTSWANGGVYTCPISGCTSSPRALALYPTWYPAAAMAIDPSGLYWTEGTPNGTIYGASSQLVRCPTPSLGCDSGLDVLATLSVGSTPAIALDPKNVYWIDSGLGAIMTRAK